MSLRNSTRRGFLKRSTAALAAGVSAPYIWTSSYAKAEDKNSRLNVAAIGVGWRGAGVGGQAGGHANMVACCDVDGNNAAGFAKHYKGNCKVYDDFRELLARGDVDCVTIATPDHWHVSIAIAAMQAGMDVYCEKPLTLTIDEGIKICQVAKETKRIVQVGTQQRSEYNRMFIKAVAIARSGRLGGTLKATASVGGSQRGGPFEETAPPPHLNWGMWLGQAPKVPYIKERSHGTFRAWLEYSGGQVTDWGVHHTDIACWALGVEHTGPTHVEGQGKFDKRKNCYNAAYSFDCTMKFAGGNSIVLNNAGGGLLIEGSQGRIFVNRGRLTGKPVEKINADAAEKKKLDDEVAQLYGGRQPTSHMANFFDCIKTRKLPVSDVFTHHRSMTCCHLANIAMLQGRKLTWDPKKENFPDDAAATAMLTRKQRKGYTLAELTG